MSFRSTPTNCVVISGRVSKAGELKLSGRGTHYLTFGLCFPELQRSVRTGEIESRDSFIDCIVYGALAKDYDGELAKDTPVVVQGRLHWDKFFDSKYNDNSRHVIRVDRLSFDGCSHED